MASAESAHGSSGLAADAASQPGVPCWKCDGSGQLQQKTGDSSEPVKSVACSVCHGGGVLVRARKLKRKRNLGAPSHPSKAGPSMPPLPWAESVSSTAWDSVAPAAGLECAVGTHFPVRADEDVTFLTGSWKLLQPLSAHRYSTDDVVTAWVAARIARCLARAEVVPGPRDERTVQPDAAAAWGGLTWLDIGCGIGSVAMMAAWAHPGATVHAVEAQVSRISRAARSAVYNLGPAAVQAAPWLARSVWNDHAPAGAPSMPGAPEFCALPVGMPASTSAASATGTSMCLHQGDLRDEGLLGAAAFPIITGTPPYFEADKAAQKGLENGGALPGDFESAGCLFELRGGIEAYAAAAARWLAPDGVFCVAETAKVTGRARAALAHAGLKQVAEVAVIPKAGKPALFLVLVAVRADYSPRWASLDALDAALAPAIRVPDSVARWEITVRDAAALRTEQYAQVLQELGKHSGAQ